MTELNFRVRNGNGWTLSNKNTNCVWWSTCVTAPEPADYTDVSQHSQSMPNGYKKDSSCDFATAVRCWHRAIFPVRRQTSIFATDELNFRVRNGNGWTLVVIDTNY